jgi:protease YdgD
MKGVAFALLTALTAAEASAQSGLEPLTRRDQLLGWEAVGRLDLGAGAFCTGTLIATDLVLTAAHCVFDKAGQPVDPRHMMFRAGYAGGKAIAQSAVKQIVAMPGYRPGQPVSAEQVRADVALVQLVQPIPAAVAAPFVIKAPGQGDGVSVVSYAEGRAEVLSWQRDCHVLDRSEALVALDCDVTFGASGAPVLDRSGAQSGARAQIVSIISAGGPTDQGQLAFGMELPGAVAALKARLAKGDGLVAVATKPGVRRIGVGDGSSRDIGARFVTP